MKASRPRTAREHDLIIARRVLRNLRGYDLNFSERKELRQAVKTFIEQTLHRKVDRQELWWWSDAELLTYAEQSLAILIRSQKEKRGFTHSP